MSVEKGFDDFRKFVKGKTFSVIGIGVSNAPLVSLLAECGASAIVARDRLPEEKLSCRNELSGAGARFVCGDGYLSGIKEDVIIKSPGIRPDIPEFVSAIREGAFLTSEMELFFEYCPAKIFAVTGSDGKTTTTTLISKLLEAAGHRVFLGGNIGEPLLPRLGMITPGDFVVCELSSFQLMTMRRSPDIAVITNLSENHLDWHRGMEEYIDAKSNILRYQPVRSIAILNYDNEYTRSLASSARGEVRFFSSKSTLKGCREGAYLSDGNFYSVKDSAASFLFERKELLLPAVHNAENLMAAYLSVRDYVGVPELVKVASSFGGVEHRLELVRELDGVRYYNGSMDSSPARTAAALQAFPEKVIVICGGYDKHLNYAPLAKPLCDHAKVCVLCGQTSDKIFNALKGFPGFDPESLKVYREDTFEGAVARARASSAPGDTVLLSPASASFDMFKNFDERGKRFKQLVNSF
ncbi:MAG: UDP-N-acetylmuramoyl-L-alanine--D-glutamate ligase [Oscillospiraceae bacterium]|nr:UDP-N-acetylmuramoyl-L-alanine--D-glutamate ligase [Oscillospiraceae bacterium]